MTAKFDPNVWYSISEARVDNTTAPLRSTLQLTDGGLRVFGLVDKQWQMQPVDDEPGRYLMRYSDTGPFQQLAICFDAGEIADSRSAACMGRSSTADEQKWDIVEWGDGTYRMHNVANGTGYALDVHPGSNLFMNNNIQGVNSEVYHKAQHWIWSSVKEVNEGAYSTIYSAAASTDTPQTTTAGASTSTGTPATTTGSGSESSPSSDSIESANGGSTENNTTSSSGGLSTGAAAGIGVGATLAVVGLALIGVFFWWKRRHYSKASNMDDSTEGGHEKHSAPPSHLYSTPPPQTADDAVKANQYPPNQYPPTQNYQAHDQARGPSVDGYYGAQDKVTSPHTNVTSPQSGYGQGHNQYPFEAPNEQIHEAPTSWHAELDAQGSGGGGRPASGSGSGMNSVQNTPAVEFAAARHRQVL